MLRPEPGLESLYDSIADILNEATKELAKNGPYKVVTKGKGVAYVMLNGKQIASGDFDDGADGWFFSSVREKNGFFDSAQKIADYFAKNKITEEAFPTKFPKELFRTKAKNGGEFVVYERDVKGAGKQDAVMMYVVKDGKTENHGSHVNVKGAKAYAKNHNII